VNDTRKLILKVLLICLAIAASTGVLAVLSSSDALGKVTGTAFLASVAALMLLGLSARLDKPATANAGLVGMAVVVIEFILVLVLIWDVTRWLGASRSEESIFVTCWVVVLYGLGLMIAMRLLASPFTRIAGWTAVVIVAAGMLAALVAAWLPGAFYEHDRWWGTAWAISGCGALAVMALVGVGSPVLPFTGDTINPAGSLRHWRWIGVIGAAIVALIALVHLWRDSDGDPRIATTIGIIAAFTGFANLVLLAPLKPPHRWLGIGTLIGGALTAVLAIFAIIVEQGGYFGFERFIAASAIPTACGSVALMILARLGRKTEFVVSDSKELRITLLCPRCRRKQDMALGGAACEGCGLKIEVKVEEPRCTQCGYLLYMLTGNVCPECGAAIETPGTTPGATSAVVPS